MVISDMGYQEKLRILYSKMLANGELQPGVFHTRVEHEDACTIWEGNNASGNRCSCDPNVAIFPHTKPSCRYCQANFTKREN